MYIRGNFYRVETMVWNNSKLSDALQLRGDNEKFSAQTTLLNLTKNFSI